MCWFATAGVPARTVGTAIYVPPLLPTARKLGGAHGISWLVTSCRREIQSTLRRNEWLIEHFNPARAGPPVAETHRPGITTRKDDRVRANSGLRARPRGGERN